MGGAGNGGLFFYTDEAASLHLSHWSYSAGVQNQRSTQRRATGKIPGPPNGRIRQVSSAPDPVGAGELAPAPDPVGAEELAPAPDPVGAGELGPSGVLQAVTVTGGVRMSNPNLYMPLADGHPKIIFATRRVF